MATVPFRGREVRVLSHERQLAVHQHTLGRIPQPSEGCVPISGRRAARCDVWTPDRLGLRPESVGRTWAATALKLMLAYSRHRQLAAVPPEVMRKLGEADRFTNAMLTATLHRFVTVFVMEGRPFSAVLTPRNRRSVWTTMVGPSAPATELWTVPLNVAFPEGKKGRLDMALAKQRLWSAARRVSKR